MSKRYQIAAEVPAELADADELLHKYGRSVMDRYKKQHCASAEGRYNIPPNDDDRSPREVLLGATDVTLVQRALIAVPELFRTVLQILYVPHRYPAEARLRRLQIPPKLSAERHLEGLKLFARQHHVESIQAERAAGGLRRIQRRSLVESMFKTIVESTLSESALKGNENA